MPHVPEPSTRQDPPSAAERPSRADVMRAVHVDLVSAEQNLYDLLHTNRVAVRAPGARQRFARFKIAEVPLDLKAGLEATTRETPPSPLPSSLAPWTPWVHLVTGPPTSAGCWCAACGTPDPAVPA
jgi:hypothetical protein